MKGTQTMYRPFSIRHVVSALSGLLLVGAGACQAQTIYTVSLNTFPLIGNANGPFSLDFQLNDGSGSNDGNNTAKISNFNFGTGGATGTPTASGGATGSLTTGITLKDTGFLNDLSQSLTPGTTLTFDFTLTHHADVGSTPDEFSFAILDGSQAEIASGPGGAFMTVDITSTGLATQTFAGVGAYSAIGAPTITATPEPGVLSLVGAGMTGSIFLLRKRKR